MTSLTNRRVRREVAREQLPRIEALAHKVKVRKPDHSHITVYIDEQTRVEWWPGSHKWRYDFGGNDVGEVRGSVTDFIKFLEDNT